MKKLAILISGRGSNMSCLLRAIKNGDVSADAALVLSNRPNAGGLEVARAMGIKTLVIDHKEFVDRAAFDQAMHKALQEHKIDFICLAGFMRLLTEDFVNAWAGRMLNIHPSLLPSFKGLDTHQQVLDAGAKLHGCSVHFVTPDLDAGPIIAQAAIPVLPGDDAQQLAERVLPLEHKLYPAALKAVMDGRMILRDGKAVAVEETSRASDTAGKSQSLFSLQ